MKIQQKQTEIPYTNPFHYYKNHSNNGGRVSLLMESRSVNLKYGKQSIVVPNAAVRVTGKNDFFSLEALTEAGELILSAFKQEDFPYATDVHISDAEISGRVQKRGNGNLEEHERIRQPNTSYVIRTILQKFPELKDEHIGLYGAFAYDFARHFENFGNRFSQGGEPDFLLFLPTTVVYFDDIRERAAIKQFYFDGKNDGLDDKLTPSNFRPSPLRIYEDMPIEEYEKKVAFIVKEIKKVD